ncbi:MAG TPA: adenylate/guanylate cyclase domain-containing protein, partial [Acidimicrobiia bacterium]|nr:adenylate/guanylate cyclase domain-containing protein [Acidimicrobiia bacterium]
MARVGIHAGPVVFRDGDYFGRTVSVAARITDYARPREVLVRSTVGQELDEEDWITVEEIGPIALKGVSDPVRLFKPAHIRSVATASSYGGGRPRRPGCAEAIPAARMPSFEEQEVIHGTGRYLLLLPPLVRPVAV